MLIVCNVLVVNEIIKWNVFCLFQLYEVNFERTLMAIIVLCIVGRNGFSREDDRHEGKARLVTSLKVVVNLLDPR